VTSAVISQILAAVIGAGGVLTAGAMSRAYERNRQLNTEKVTQQEKVADTISGLKAVVEKLDEIKKEWRVDRQTFQSWQLRVEQRLARVEGRTGAPAPSTDPVPVWNSDIAG
jgi:outer membrane murein-binding lipoprotein Lpp